MPAEQKIDEIRYYTLSRNGVCNKEKNKTPRANEILSRYGTQLSFPFQNFLIVYIFDTLVCEYAIDRCCGHIAQQSRFVSWSIFGQIDRWENAPLSLLRLIGINLANLTTRERSLLVHPRPRRNWMELICRITRDKPSNDKPLRFFALWLRGKNLLN